MANRELDAFLGSRPPRAAQVWLGLAALVVALGVAFFLLMRFLNGPDLPYYTAQATRGDLTPVLSAQGMLHATDETILRANQDGVMLDVPGPADGPVAMGQVLARLDGAELLTLLAQARARQVQARQTAEMARAAKELAATRLIRYDDVWRRSAHRVPALNEMEDARAAVSRASAALDTAQAALASGDAQIRLIQARLAATVITAPFDGAVVARMVVPGQAVRAGTPLFAIAPRRDRLVVEVPLTATDAMQVTPQAHGFVLAPAASPAPTPALPSAPRAATVERIDADATQGEGRYRARLRLDTPNAPLRPGMVVTVEINLATRHNVLLVPNAALKFAPRGLRPGGNVYVLGSDLQPRQIPVAVAASDGKRTEVIANGLEPGAQVITSRRH